MDYETTQHCLEQIGKAQVLLDGLYEIFEDIRETHELYVGLDERRSHPEKGYLWFASIWMPDQVTMLHQQLMLMENSLSKDNTDMFVNRSLVVESNR